MDSGCDGSCDAATAGHSMSVLSRDLNLRERATDHALDVASHALCAQCPSWQQLTDAQNGTIALLCAAIETYGIQCAQNLQATLLDVPLSRAQ